MGKFIKLQRLFDIIYNLIVLNILFIIGLLLSGIILGILPGMYSLVKEIEKIIIGEETSIKSFFHNYKSSFLFINKSYSKLLLLIVAWFIQIVFFYQVVNTIYFAVTGILLFLFVVYATNIPLNDKNRHLKNLVEIFLINPKLNIYLILLGIIFIYMSERVSGLWLFLSFSSYQFLFERAKKTLLRI